MYNFEIGMKRRIFDTLFDLFVEKKFSSLSRDKGSFRELKKVKTAQYFKKRFFKNRS